LAWQNSQRLRPKIGENYEEHPSKETTKKSQRNHLIKDISESGKSAKI